MLLAMTREVMWQAVFVLLSTSFLGWLLIGIREAIINSAKNAAIRVEEVAKRVENVKETLAQSVSKTAEMVEEVRSTLDAERRIQQKFIQEWIKSHPDPVLDSAPIAQLLTPTELGSKDR